MPQEKIDLLKRTVAKGTDNDQFELFLSVCQRHGLDPFVKQVYCVLWPVSKHHQDEKGIWLPGHDMVIITGIGGYRKMAARDHRDYAGSSDASFTWFDPPRKTPAGRTIPESATVRIHRRGAEDTIATVYWEEFAPGDLTDRRADFWNRTPKNQLEKCAEAKGLRKAFPGLGDVFTEEELSQRLQDITPGGREIVQGDGMSPSGRPLTYEARMAANLPEVTEGVPRGGSREAAQAVLKQKLGAAKTSEGERNSNAGDGVSPSTAPSPFLGSIEVDWTNEKEPIVRGDLSDLLPTMQKHFGMAHYDDWWHIVPKDVIRLKELCKVSNYEFREIVPTKSSPNPQRQAGAKATARGAAPKDASVSAAPAVVKGVIQKVNAAMTQNNVPTRQVQIDKTWHTCFSQTLHEFLDGKHGKVIGVEGEFYISGPYKNLVGFKRIGKRTFAEDGKTPEVQRSEERGGSLFG